jgi:hypothetical protein
LVDIATYYQTPEVMLPVFRFLETKAAPPIGNFSRGGSEALFAVTMFMVRDPAFDVKK